MKTSRENNFKATKSDSEIGIRSSWIFSWSHRNTLFLNFFSRSFDAKTCQKVSHSSLFLSYIPKYATNMPKFCSICLCRLQFSCYAWIITFPPCFFCDWMWFWIKWDLDVVGGCIMVPFCFWSWLFGRKVFLEMN